MTRERRDRIEEISKAISGFRSELCSMYLDETRQLPSMIDDRVKLQESCDQIKELRKATDLFSDGLWELGFYY